MKKLLIAILLLLPGYISAQVNVTADITANTTWSASNVYVLDGLIFVHSGVTLTIEAGTIIKGKLQANITTGDGASALIVRRGAYIIANGAADAPIIFTSELDDISNPNDLGIDDKQLWGGLILLGKAVTNQPTTDNQIEGIPTTEDALFGGTDDNDSSGVIRYVSVRHGGFSISGVEGDEINGITFGAVGSRTVVEYVEVFANFDDGYEWFGGTVNVKYLVSAFCGDDGIDWDMGFRGKGQYWFVIQSSTEAGRGGELDGGDDNETGQPYAAPQLSNATWIGAGATSVGVGGDGNDYGLYFRDNSGGKVWNSILTDFVANSGAVYVEDLASGEDSRSRLDGGDLVLNNNIWWGFSNGNTLESVAPQNFLQTYLTSNNNQVADPEIMSISRTNDGNLNPRPNPSGPAGSGAAVLTDPFFTQTTYFGAFDPNAPLWTNGWTALSSTGVSGVKEDQISDLTPSQFNLTQNYPNPFNPTTRISYSLPFSSNVKLTIYNSLGQVVEVLADGFRNAGTYEITWEASNLSSGIYIYTMQSENSIVTRKMTLLK